MLTTLHTLVEKAEKFGYAIPAFNVTNLESAQAAVRAAVALRSPVIIQTSESAITYAGHSTLLGIMESLARTEGKAIPVVTHLDHGKHFAVVKKCIDLGYRSVHMDASEQPWATNISLTKRAVALGHRHRITVQGELGYLLGYEGMTGKGFTRGDITKIMTDPDQAAEFVQRTGVDTLAIAVGTAHGEFRGKERIEFGVLKEINKKVKVPLVLHGGSGVPDAHIRRAIKSGIRIINVDTSLRIAFMIALQQSMRRFDPKKKVDLRMPLTYARNAMELRARKVITLFGSNGRA